MASNTAAQCEGNRVRLKFLPLEWAVDTMVGSAQIAELLKTSCGLECRRIDITNGYRHQQGGLGPMYAYAYIQVEHLEDAIAVVSRMSVQLLQGTRVRATLKEPGHPKTYGQGGLTPTGDPGQRREPQGKSQRQKQRGKSDLPCSSGLREENHAQKDSDGTPYTAWEDECVWVFSSEEEDGQWPPRTTGMNHQQGLRWGLKPQVSKWDEKDRFQAVLATQERVILTTYRHGRNYQLHHADHDVTKQGTLWDYEHVHLGQTWAATSLTEPIQEVQKKMIKLKIQ